jgi:hypothetical protein
MSLQVPIPVKALHREILQVQEITLPERIPGKVQE